MRLKFLLSKEESKQTVTTSLSAEQQYKNYFNRQFQTTQRILEQMGASDLQGKRVLEIGCGIGGRTAYFAQCGAKEAVGIDINKEEIDIANSILTEEYSSICDKVSYLASEEQGTLDIGQFDYVFLIDAIEHAISPAQFLNLALEYTKPGGICFYSFIGFYHARGSHISLFPFVNVFFSDEAILNAIRWKISRKNYVPSRFDSNPPVKRWLGLYDLRDRPGEYLNKLTISKAKILNRNSQFAEVKMKIHGFRSGNPVVKLLNIFRHIPIINEMLHSYVTVSCKRL